MTKWWKKRNTRLSSYVEGKGKFDRLAVEEIVEFSPDEDGLRGT